MSTWKQQAEADQLAAQQLQQSTLLVEGVKKHLILEAAAEADPEQEEKAEAGAP